MLTKAISTAFYIVDMIKYIASTQGISFATATWGVAQSSLNAAMLANPVGAFLLILAGLALAIYGVIKAIDAFDEPYKAAFERKEALRQEAFSVIELRDQYLALGRTLQQSEQMAVSKASRNLQAEIIAAKMQLSSVDPNERDLGVSAMNNIQGKAQQLANFNKKGSSAFGEDYGQKYANTKELSTKVGSIGQEGATMNASPDWGIKPMVNPKAAQQQGMVNTVTNTEKQEFTFFVKNDSNSEVGVKGKDGSTASESGATAIKRARPSG